MAYDEELAARLQAALEGEPGLHEKRMFGGLGFLVDGNLAVSASGLGGLLVRVDPADTERLVDPPEVDRFEMRGRRMDGWLHVLPAAARSAEDLQRWVDIGLRYARTLPPK
jgi:hypothetical protein